MHDSIDSIVRKNMTGEIPEVNLTDAEKHYISKPLVEGNSSEVGAVVQKSPERPTLNHPDVERADSASLPKPPDTVPEEAIKIMGELDPDNPGMYKHPHHFAQTGNRTGFSYLYIDPKTKKPNNVVFEQGVFVTKDVYLIDLLNKDINRKGGIGRFIKNITAANYSELIAANRQYQRLLASTGGTGMAGSNQGDPHKMEQAIKMKQLQEVVEQQKQKIKQLEQSSRKETVAAPTVANPNTGPAPTVKPTEEPASDFTPPIKSDNSSASAIGTLLGTSAN